MANLGAKTVETAKPLPWKERLLGDGVFLRIRPNGSKTWVIEYKFRGRRRKSTVGVYDPAGAGGESITAWLGHGRLSLAQARSIAGAWRARRRAGHDPAAEWETRLETMEAAAAEAMNAARIESEQPTVRRVIDLFIAKHIKGKKRAGYSVSP